MTQTCLILGGGGFIGSHLIEELLNYGYKVKIFDVKNFSRHNISEYQGRIEIIEGDFNNNSDLRGAIGGIDFIYHLISTTLPANSILNPIYDIESNVLPSIKLLQLCVEFKIKKVVFVSSGGTVYGVPLAIPIKENHISNPINSYGITKRTIESYFNLFNKLWGLDVCILRLSNPYGEKQNPYGIQGAIPVFINKAIKNEAIDIWGNGEIIRDYIYIKDVTKVLVHSIRISTPEITYNLGSGVGKSLNHILFLIKATINPNLQVNYLEARNFDVLTNILDITLLKERFKIKGFMNLEEGMVKVFTHLKNTP